MIPNPELILPTIRQALVEFQATIDALTEGHWEKVNETMVKDIRQKMHAHCELQKVLEGQVKSPLASGGGITIEAYDYEIDN